MAKQELVNWINENKTQHSEEEMTEQLIRNGWNTVDIKEAMDDVWETPGRHKKEQQTASGSSGGKGWLIALFIVILIIGVTGAFIGGMYYRDINKPAEENKNQNAPVIINENTNTNKNLNSDNGNNNKNINSGNDNSTNKQTNTNGNENATNSSNYNTSQNKNSNENRDSSVDNTATGAYLDSVIPMLEDMETISDSVSSAIDAGENGQSEVAGQTIGKERAELEKIYNQLASEQVPAELEIYHDLVLQILDTYIEACKDIEEGYSTGNNDLVEQGGNKIEGITELWNEAAAELDKL